MKKDRNERRQVIHRRIRRRVAGNGERPRLSIYRTLNHIYAQAIDDAEGKTLAQASTLDASMKGKAGGNVDAAKAVGTLIADRLKKLGVEQVVFDRGGYLYHGRVKALAEAAREAGIQF
jgi:large subunit ribosomal protein L18